MKPAAGMCVGDEPLEISQRWIDEVYNADGPEADLLAVANGDFSRLSLPILVACHDDEQLAEFVFREGLVCSEVRRYRAGFRWGPGQAMDPSHARKILLLLPGWDEDSASRAAVTHWVGDLDRYTCALNSPRPLTQRQRNGVTIFVVAAVLWVVAIVVARFLI